MVQVSWIGFVCGCHRFVSSRFRVLGRFDFAFGLCVGDLVVVVCRLFSRFSVLLVWCEFGLLGRLGLVVWVDFLGVCLHIVDLRLGYLFAYLLVDCGGLVVGRFVAVVVFGCALAVCFVWWLFVIYLLIVLLPIH